MRSIRTAAGDQPTQWDLSHLGQTGWLWESGWAGGLKTSPAHSLFLGVGLNPMPYFESFVKALSGVYWTSACRSLILSPSLHDWLMSAGELLWPCSADPGNLRWTRLSCGWWRGWWGLSVPGTLWGGATCCLCKRFAAKAGWISWLELFLRTSGTALLYENMYVREQVQANEWGTNCLTS